MGFVPVAKEVIGKQEPENKPPTAQTKLQKPAEAAQRKQYLKQEAKAHHQIWRWKKILLPWKTKADSHEEV